MTDHYTILAELLRELAAKMPEKFQVTDIEYMHFSPEGGLPKSYNQCIELAELSDPIVLSQDDMDAICGAVDMCFGVDLDWSNGTWLFTSYHSPFAHHEGHGGFASKRLASVHATIACIQYALEGKDGRRNKRRH